MLLTLTSCNSATQKAGALLWRFEIGGQLWAPLRYDSGNLFFGSDDANFYSFDVATQTVNWKFKTGGIIRSEADVTDGIVAFASDDGNLYALDSDSGNELWRFNLGSSEIDRRLPATDAPFEYDYLHSSPKYHAGRIYIGSSNGNLYAIDHKTGEEDWHFETGQKIRSTPTVENGNIYFGSWDGNVYNVSLETGKKIWQFDSKGIVQGSPAVGSGKVFVGSRGAKVLALDAHTGEKKWEFVHEDGSWVESSPVFYNGEVYIGSSDALKLSAFDASTGQVKWEFKTGGWSWSKPSVANGVVYIGSLSASPYYFDGVELEAGFYAVDQHSGNEIWSMNTDSVDGYITSGVFASAVIVDEVVYVAGIDGYLYAMQE
jgi:outer membrane protein assembly factor BamB